MLQPGPAYSFLQWSFEDEHTRPVAVRLTAMCAELMGSGVHPPTVTAIPRPVKDAEISAPGVLCHTTPLVPLAGRQRSSVGVGNATVSRGERSTTAAARELPPVLAHGAWRGCAQRAVFNDRCAFTAP